MSRFARGMSLILLCCGSAVTALADESAALAERPTDGPMIGVLLYRNPGPLKLYSPAKIQVEARDSGVLEIGAGAACTLRLESTAQGPIARIGDTEFAPGEPLRMRARSNHIHLGIVEPGADASKIRPEKFHGYEGWLELTWQPPQVEGGAGRWLIVNRVPLERYLLGVIGAEVPASSPAEALRAQAIASRTYALFQLVTRAPGAVFHITGDTSGQVYRGGAHADARVAPAVDGTRHQVLMYNERLFCSYYHSTCGGTTQSAASAFGSARIPPLEPVTCNNCASADYAKWEAKYSIADLERVLRDYVERHGVAALGAIRKIEPIDREKGGYASYVRIEHAGGSFEMEAQEFRMFALRLKSAVGPLRSTFFDCERDGDSMVFHGRGWGHGVGMCQNGAIGLAKRKYDAQAILSYYYPGAKLYELVWQ
ncbi:MAG: SpoIID/LytB domain-containing protein [Planctomycetota bacterium]